MKYFGDIAEDGTIHLAFNTNDADGAAITIVGGTYRIYKDDATGTETATGLTMSIDHDGKVGSHLATVIATDVFYATGADYFLHVDEGAVDSNTVTAFLAGFSIENRFKRGTDSALLAVSAPNNFPSLIINAGGYAGMSWAQIGSADATVGLTGTTVAVVTDVTNGVSIVDDGITSAKYDESTAFPIGRADSGSSLVARTGADGDTLEDLSDEIAGVSSSATPIAQRVWDGTVALSDRSINLEEISRSGVTETSSGRLAKNLSTILDNADADTTKTADDIGGAGAPRIE
jgi:hypothetical protein